MIIILQDSLNLNFTPKTLVCYVLTWVLGMRCVNVVVFCLAWLL